MGLSRNKVAVPEGAAGTPPFWRIRKEFLLELTELRRSQVKLRNTSFLERALLPLRGSFRATGIGSEEPVRLACPCFLYSDSVSMGD